MQSLWIFLVFFILSVQSLVEEEDSRELDHEKKHIYVIEHSFDGTQSFHLRSHLELQVHKKQHQKVYTNDLQSLTSDQQQQLKHLIQTNGLYTLRAKLISINDEPMDRPYVLSTYPACLLAHAQWKDSLALHLTSTGELLALEYRTPSTSTPFTQLNQECREKTWTSPSDFISTASAVFPQSGPTVPFVAEGNAPAPPGVKAVGTDGKAAPEENQSFLRKYWYIILPIVVLTFLTGPEEEQQGAGGNAGGARGGQRR